MTKEQKMNPPRELASPTLANHHELSLKHRRLGDCVLAACAGVAVGRVSARRCLHSRAAADGAQIRHPGTPIEGRRVR